MPNQAVIEHADTEVSEAIAKQSGPERPRDKTLFSHVKPADTPWRGDGLRGFFEYRDLGIKDATHGNVIAHLVRPSCPRLKAPAGTTTSPISRSC